MRAMLAFIVFPLVFLGTPLHAESLCLKCLSAAQKELKKCLDAAISQEDKNSCADKQEVHSKTCEDGECKIERAVQSGNKNEGAVQEKSPEKK